MSQFEATEGVRMCAEREKKYLGGEKDPGCVKKLTYLKNLHPWRRMALNHRARACSTVFVLVWNFQIVFFYQGYPRGYERAGAFSISFTGVKFLSHPVVGKFLNVYFATRDIFSNKVQFGLICEHNRLILPHKRHIFRKYSRIFIK